MRSEIPSNMSAEQQVVEAVMQTHGVAMSENPVQEIALIGFGEFGGIFGSDLAAAGIRVSVFDILFNPGQSRAAMLAKARDANVHACDGLEEAVRSAELVISAVTCSA